MRHMEPYQLASTLGHVHPCVLQVVATTHDPHVLPLQEKWPHPMYAHVLTQVPRRRHQDAPPKVLMSNNYDKGKISISKRGSILCASGAISSAHPESVS